MLFWWLSQVLGSDIDCRFASLAVTGLPTHLGPPLVPQLASVQLADGRDLRQHADALSQLAIRQLARANMLKKAVADLGSLHRMPHRAVASFALSQELDHFRNEWQAIIDFED